MISDKKIKDTIEIINSMSGTNRNDIYNSHLYWSQKPYNICNVLLDKLALPNSIVCDPFMGSGVTIIQSLRKKSEIKPIGIEINDYPIFLVDTLLKKHDISKIKKQFTEIKKSINEKNSIYETKCHICGNKAMIDKTLFNYNHEAMVPEKIFYRCNCNRGQLNKSASKEDQDNFHFFDNTKFNNFNNIDLLENSRIAVRKDQTIYDIFTSRNIKALDDLIGLINKEEKDFQEILLYSLLGIIHLSKITDLKSSSQWPLWTPKKDCVEKNVFQLFEKALDKSFKSIVAVENELIPIRNKVNKFEELNNESYLIIRKGTQTIGQSDIPDEVVDLVITDPPYLGQVIYSEYMQLYKPFLKNKIDYNQEIVIANNKIRKKTEDLYYKELMLAFMQISRIMKKNSILCLYFHDSNLKFWNKFNNILEKSGFSFIAQTHINKSKQTLKNIVSPKKSMNGDALMFYRKSETIMTKKYDGDYITEIINIATDIINKNDGKATTAELYDNGVLGFTIKNGILEEISKKYNDFTEIFSKELNWNEKGYWSL